MNEPSQEVSRQARTALDTLSDYLSDTIPPLFLAEGFTALVAVPPELVAAQIVGWSSSQTSPGGPLPTADYIFHAAKKIHLLAELELVPGETMEGFLAQLRPALLAQCPEADRASLAVDLARLDLQVSMTSSTSVEVVYRRSGSAEPQRSAAVRGVKSPGPGGAGQPDSPAAGVGEGLLRLDRLLQRLDLQSAAPGSALEASGRFGLTAQVVTQGAQQASNTVEMEHLLAELQRRGLPSNAEGLLGLLAKNLPDWAAPASATPDDAPQGAVRAMHRFISLAADQEEMQHRFAELVDTAIGEFNEGSLGRSVTLIDLATGMIERKEVAELFAQSVQRTALGKIDRERLRRAAEAEMHHHLLRRLLRFFPQLTPESLLLELDGEPSRERRRALLDLLVAHGDATRQAVLGDLAKAVSGEATFHWYYSRNLVYLLRRIPRPADADFDLEVDTLVHMTEVDAQMQLIREAFVTLAQIPGQRAAKALGARLAELEEALLEERALPHDAPQVSALLDTAVRSLIRMNESEARRAVVAHGLNRQPQLGDTLERLAWLIDQSLAGEPDLVERLLREIRAELPRKVFGVSLKSSRATRLVEVLVGVVSSTDTPEVRTLLGEIVEGFSGRPFAETARAALQRFDKGSGGLRPEAAPVLAGDLELFGLPNLLQNLADSQIGGVLKVTDREAQVVARLWLAEGKVLGAEAGSLSGESAVYQVLEDPAPGRFVLSEPETPPRALQTAEGPISIQALLFEGIRRYDEFKRAAALVPDTMRLQPTGRQPSLPEEETNAVLFKEIWSKARTGATPAQCEAEVAVERFRIRRFFEHWMTEGSLVQSDADAGADSAAATTP